MPLHLTKLPRGIALPDATSLEDGYPYWRSSDDTLHVVEAGAWVQYTGVSLDAVTAAHTVADDGRRAYVLGDATAAAFAVTLPTAVEGREVVVKKVDASVNAVTVETPGAETIDGAANHALAAQYDVVRLVCDGANWSVV